jgi:hypothetical protein
MGKPTFSTSLGIFFVEGLTAMFPVYIEIQKQCKKIRTSFGKGNGKK